MPKRGASKGILIGINKKNSVAKKPAKKKSEIEQTLLKNLVELQKVHIDLAEKFDKLSKEISGLLSLFEITARNFAKNAPQTAEYEKDKDFLEKIDRLLDQNKTLAKGLSLMEERMRERMYSPRPSPRKNEPFEQSIVSEKRPLPHF
ncbi:MAG: hypothetical protein KJ600_02880 [Nanoarchaeota archaeon]|nr:hypothetical protein [Nanoarchaeota archaeon]MBU1103473.1 hypothetical protein [Nanoarchaeota archaeon]